MGKNICSECGHTQEEHSFCPSHNRMECTKLVRRNNDYVYCGCMDYGNAKEAREKSRGPSVRYGAKG